MSNETSARIHKFFSLGCLTLIVVMPFHAFAVITLGHFIGYQSIWQAWKEILLLLLALTAISTPSLRSKLWQLRTDKLTWAITIYMFISVMVSLLNQELSVGFLFGLKTNFEFLILFILARLTSMKEVRLAQFIIFPGLVVALIAILQVTIIPISVLEWLGYSSATIQPAQYIFGPSSPLRAFSTIGGPNQLGAYLLIPISLVLWRLSHQLTKTDAAIASTLVAALVVTYSRSAWLGLIAAVIVLVISRLTLKKAVLWLGFGAFAVAVVLGTTIKTIGPSASEALLLHGSYEDKLIGSDVDRISSLNKGFQALRENPLGYGLGTSGPAVFHSGKGLITENYYLQIGIEAGILGLGLFLYISYALAIRLKNLSLTNHLSVPLVAALCGIAVINLFLHGWADSTTALVYWGTAGLVLGTTHVTAKKI